MNIFEPHSFKQNQAIVSEKRILLLATGTQWGKTRVGAIRMKMKTHQFTSKNDNFLITAPSYKTMHQSTLPAFLEFMDGYGNYDKKFDVFRLNTGGNVYCRTETDPDSIVGITNIRHVWSDEAGKYRLYFWENIQARADFCGAGIDLTTSPYSMNWVAKELIFPTQKGARKDVEYITAASWDSKYHSLFDPERRALKQATMDPRRFNMIFGGEFGQMAGLVYDNFEENLHVIEPFQLPSGTKFYGGIDWGYTDPFVISVRALTPTGHQFKVSEFYKTGLTVNEMIVAAKQKMTIFNIEKFYADPSRPEYIESFNRERIPTIKADNSIRMGIDAHYELIQSGKYKIFAKTSPHTIDEYASYHYPEEKDLSPDQDTKEVLPVDAGNHCIAEDSLIHTKRGLVKIQDVVVGDLIMTRYGFNKVLLKHDNGTKECIKINGVESTKDHLILSVFNGYIRADSLIEGDIICQPKESFLKALYIVAILNLNTQVFVITLLESLRESLNTCTGLFGQKKTDKSQKGTKYITKTETHSIMIFLIWSAFFQVSIFLNTLRRGIVKTKKKLEVILRLREKKLNYGTNQKMERSGMLNTLKLAQQNALILFLDVVIYALKNINTALLHLDFVAAPVKLDILDMPKKQVYDLTVQSAHEFLANGVMVHNCMDTERYLTMALKSKTIEKRGPIIPNEGMSDRIKQDHNERIKYLKKIKKHNGSEVW